MLAAQQTAGVAPAWDTGTLFSRLQQDSAKLEPLLKQVKPNEWKSAPGAYGKALEQLVEQNRAAATRAQSLAKTPDKLADSIELMRALHGVDTLLATLVEGVRQYQNPALAELISGVAAEGSPAREAFAARVLDIASEREQQYQLVDHEAQRCREMLSKSPGRERRK